MIQNPLKQKWGIGLTLEEKAFRALEVKELKFLKKQETKEAAWMNQKLNEVVPNQLEEKLKLAFKKAFEWVFEKGTPIIEKTYKKEEHKQNYKINDYTAQLKQNRKTIKAFSNQAQKSQLKNLAVSAVEGIGLGALGVGLPDIPLFTGVILKSIYETALSYGFDYQKTEEQLFILKLIEVSLLGGEDLIKENQKINEWIKIEANQVVPSGFEVSKEQKLQIEKTASALADELLYMKFLQGIPIVGVIGGAGDVLCLRKIMTYVELKYKRRFLYRRIIKC